MTRVFMEWNRARGVSLIEAVVAIAVMSIGMLALVGVQGTLRFNSDLSRQRAEASRIATQELEQLRDFQHLTGDTGQTWSGIDNRSGSPTLDGTHNASYTVTRKVVNSSAGARRKVVEVKVSWTDRNGGAQEVVLHTLIAAADPVLSGLLAAPVTAHAYTTREGRHASIPVEATNLGDSGTSAYRPPGNNSVAWVFDNKTGLVTSACTGVTISQSALNQVDQLTTNCSAVSGRAVVGAVRFHLSASAAVTLDNAAAPEGPTLALNTATPLIMSGGVNVTEDSPACYSDSPIDATDAADTARYAAVRYACLVKLTDSSLGWGGQLNLSSGTFSDGTGAWTIAATDDPASLNYRVCRYTMYQEPIRFVSAYDGSVRIYDNPDNVPNAQHPKIYCRTDPTEPTTCDSRVTQSLVNQNFLVIHGSNSCPSDSRTLSANPADATQTQVIVNTRPHQP